MKCPSSKWSLPPWITSIYSFYKMAHWHMVGAALFRNHLLTSYVPTVSVFWAFIRQAILNPASSCHLNINWMCNWPFCLLKNNQNYFVFNCLLATHSCTKDNTIFRVPRVKAALENPWFYARITETYNIKEAPNYSYVIDWRRGELHALTPFPH